MLLTSFFSLHYYYHYRYYTSTTANVIKRIQTHTEREKAGKKNVNPITK